MWTKLGGGTNIILDMGHAVSTPAVLVDLTKNKTNNSQPAWQPVRSRPRPRKCPWRHSCPGWVSPFWPARSCSIADAGESS